MDSNNRPRAIWSRLGGQLGVGLCLVGFLLVFLGWNGAASVDRVTAQFPYLLSGGIAGLCFVVLGVGMIVVQNQRADRAALQSTLKELQEALERAGLAEGTGERRTTFRRPEPRPDAVAAAAMSPAERAVTPTAVETGEDPTAEEPVPARPVKAAPRKATTKTTKKAAGPTAAKAPKRG